VTKETSETLQSLIFGLAGAVIAVVIGVSAVSCNQRDNETRQLCLKVGRPTADCVLLKSP